MMTLQAQWIMTADERRANLYSCEMTAGSRWHAEQQQSLENRWEHYHEEHRPSALGRGPVASAAQHFASIGHEPEEEHRRFAREVVELLKRAVRDFGAQHIHVFAASRFLGLLRKEIGHLGNQVDLHECELTRLSTQGITAHPAVIHALESRIATP